MSSTVAPEKMKRRQQIVATYRMAKKDDRWLGPILLGTFLVAGALGFLLFWVLPGDGLIGTALAVFGAFMAALLATTLVFGRRAQASAYRQMEGRLGAAANALSMLRRGWKVEQAVGFTKQQDIVHRVVGPPGIVLVGEGQPTRVRSLLATERRKHERVAYEVPIHEVVVGAGEDAVPLPKLVRKLTKMKRQLKPAEITDLLYRLRALDAQRGAMPIPKGPVPTSMKGFRGQQRGR